MARKSCDHSQTLFQYGIWRGRPSLISATGYLIVCSVKLFRMVFLRVIVDRQIEFSIDYLFIFSIQIHTYAYIEILENCYGFQFKKNSQ